MHEKQYDCAKLINFSLKYLSTTHVPQLTHYEANTTYSFMDGYLFLRKRAK